VRCSTTVFSLAEQGASALWSALSYTALSVEWTKLPPAFAAMWELCRWGAVTTPVERGGRPRRGTSVGASETGDEGGAGGRFSSTSSEPATGGGASGARAVILERTSSTTSWSRPAFGGPWS
jgi:hypothetical protein